MSQTHFHLLHFHIRVRLVLRLTHCLTFFLSLHRTRIYSNSNSLSLAHFSSASTYVVDCRRFCMLLQLESYYSTVMIFTSSLLLYCLLVSCCLMLPNGGRCNSLKLGPRHTRPPGGLLLKEESPSDSAAAAAHPLLRTLYWNPRFPTYAWPLISRPQWNQLDIQNCCEYICLLVYLSFHFLLGK